MTRASGPAAAGGGVREEARAKVNLHLHVTGRRADGYHLLDSLAAFPAIGDSIEAAPADALTLEIDGPFAAGLSPGPDNLALRAALTLRAAAGLRAGAALRLTKRLPAASGIGGGSADAAAALRALNRLWGLALPAEELERIGAGLGADVPVCVASVPRLMRGIGDALSPARLPAGLFMTLANPGVEVSTPAVFRALARRDSPPAGPPPEGGAQAFADWLRGTRNDLEPAAASLVPAIAQVRRALAEAPGCLLARMSGSGATCYGLFARADAAEAAAAAARARGWWAASGALD